MMRTHSERSIKPEGFGVGLSQMSCETLSVCAVASLMDRHRKLGPAGSHHRKPDGQPNAGEGGTLPVARAPHPVQRMPVVQRLCLPVGRARRAGGIPVRKPVDATIYGAPRRVALLGRTRQVHAWLKVWIVVSVLGISGLPLEQGHVVGPTREGCGELKL